MLKVLRAIVLYVGFMFVIAVLVASAMPDAPPVLAAALILGVPFWLVRRSMRAKKSRAATPPSPPTEERRREGSKVPQKPKAPETLEEFEQAHAGEPALHWVQNAAVGIRASQSPKPRTQEPVKSPWGGTTRASTPPVERTPPQGWVPPGGKTEVAGRIIGDMVYVGPASGEQGRSRGWIDPALPAMAGGRDKSGSDMPYWPSYASIPPRSRATYLDWLAGGRADGSYDAGYMFLYFYGLERRFLRDEPPDNERRRILAEVARLKDLYAASGSAQRYLGEFMQLASCMMDGTAQEPPPVSESWELPLALRFALGVRIAEGKPLDGGWLLAWFKAHPDRNLRTAARRCDGEFDALFRILFDRRFPQGLQVRPPRKSLSVTYRAASGEFEVEFAPKMSGRPVTDIAGLRKPVEIAQELADETCEALDKFSRYLGRNPEGRGTLEAHALLPLELAAAFPSDQLDALREWVAGIVADGGLVQTDELLTTIEGTPSSKISRRQLTDAADVLGRIGFGLAPDSRFALRAPRLDEPVVLFNLPEPVGNLEEVTEDFRNGLLQIALGCIVAQADGQVTSDERSALRAQVDELPSLANAERIRLSANLDWFLAVPPDMSQLRGRMKEVSKGQEAGLRQAVVAIANTDGEIAPSEVAGVERIYRALGLNPAHVYSDLHTGAVPDEPVRVRDADPQSQGEAIPPERRGSRLDPQRIAAIRADTARASAVLGEIFSVETDAADLPVQSAPEILDGLDRRHGELVRDLIAFARWSEGDFARLVTGHGLMPAGALEALNEWSWDRYDDALIEEYDGLEISAMLAERIGLELTGKGA